MSGRPGTIACARAIALEGLRGAVVDVETHIADGLPAFVLIGLPDTALGEAKDRVRAAVQSAGCRMPAQRVTTNLSPAGIRKHGSGFDLAIAISIMAAAGVIDPTGPARAIHFGELGLDGGLRAAPGVLPVAVAAREAGFERLLVPLECAAEAGLVEGIEVLGVRSLRQAALGYGADPDALGEEIEQALGSSPRGAAGPRGEGAGTATAAPARPVPELGEVIGNAEAVRALQIAAVGGHHLFMVGPPGSGKTMLAERLPAILPDLDQDEAIETAAVRSLRGLAPGPALDRRPPFEAPHHTASAIALLGGGSGQIRPGAISLATNGVLFLDEAPEFPRTVLDALRQPLESGSMTIHRANAVAAFPARSQLVLAANPCPCGDDERSCSCPPQARRRYLAKLSGPLLDRIDLRIAVAPPSPAERSLAADGGAAHSRHACTTAQARERVEQARARAAGRLEGTPWRRNGEVDGAWLRQDARRRAPEVLEVVDRALARGLITMRGAARALRVAWSIADLDGADGVRPEHVREALAYRGAAA